MQLNAVYRLGRDLHLLGKRRQAPLRLTQYARSNTAILCSEAQRPEARSVQMRLEK